ncbi:Lrp/AsnC family transcriptional regulator [Sinirhodobacter huangdaonensis]|uniref:Lrp/AsnC family transcriptional regulator n=2 Tax=Paenirhodobacter huangdaonensis TaxID=2501515 RepID=A0A443LI73_9RHOB|nr:Lrp/AsnC family transcriptional regulator [Sinirhodobacter huangdaonensis]
MPMSDLDRLDIAILEALQDNARTPLSEVGRRVGLSQPATSERVKRLEDRGIIAGYAVRLDPAALGLGMMAIIRLKTTHEHIKPALRAFAEMPHVIEVHRLTGEDCFLLKVLVPTPGQLETIVDTIARFGAITTSLVLRSEPVKPLGKALLG